MLGLRVKLSVRLFTWLAVIDDNLSVAAKRAAGSWNHITMSKRDDVDTKEYYFIDVNLRTRQLIGWGCEQKDEVEVNLTAGYHRVFLSKGQYNKLEKKLLEFSAPIPKER
jgi:hypothetical protein